MKTLSLMVLFLLIYRVLRDQEEIARLKQENESLKRKLNDKK